MLHFIINPAARSGKCEDIWQSMENDMRAALKEYSVFRTERPGHAAEIASELTENFEKDDIIAFLGGDGTVNEVFSGLNADHCPPILYIPAGSGNDFARGLGLRIKPDNAAALLSKPEELVPRPVRRSHIQTDSGLYCRFMVSSGAGYDAHVCYDLRQSKLKQFLNRFGLGKLAYLFIGIKNMFGCPLTSGRFTNEDTGEVLTFKKLAFISAHNLPFEGGGFRFAPQADCTDDLLDFCLVTAKNHLDFLSKLALSCFKGKHLKAKGVYYIRCHKATLELDQPLCVHYDGETPGFASRISYENESEPFTLLS